jgi:UDP-GlcNAc:undecaprenyl-phosphate GlcNAc-1-phosphate transferase
MGDSGSLSLGFIIAILAILSLKYIHPIAALYFTALPIYDTFTVIIRRVRKGIPIFKPDQTHIHHLLMKYIGDRDNKGKRTGTRRTVSILVVLQYLFTFTGLQINHLLAIGYDVALLALLVFLLGILGVYYITIELEKVE